MGSRDAGDPCEANLQHFEPLDQPLPVGVAFASAGVVMDWAVDLYDESQMIAVEVDDERPKRVLPSKLQAMESSSTHSLPDSSL